MATDPNVGVPDVAVVHSADVRVRVPAPAVCGRCAGDRWIDISKYSVLPDIVIEFPCPDCCCQVCGSPTDVIGGECGQCADEADAYAVRLADR